MNFGRSHLTVFAVLLALSRATALQAKDEPTKADFELGTKLFPKHVHWQEEIKGETVVMDIDAEYFVAAKHKVRRNGGYVDGYQALPGYSTGWGSKFPFFTINSWKIRWGHRWLRLFPRGVYTSVFTPRLGEAGNPLDEQGVVSVCDEGDTLLFTVGFGMDGVTGTITFVITKDGRVRRFVVGGSS